MSEYIELFRFVTTETIDLILIAGSGFLKLVIILLAVILPFLMIIFVISSIVYLISKLLSLIPSNEVKHDANQPVMLTAIPKKPEVPVAKMHYTHTNSKGVKYYLNKKDVVLRGGKSQTIYYFSKDFREEACVLPPGFTVNENPRNGFLTIRRPL